MLCPNCGSNHISIKTSTNTVVKNKTKGFGFIKACIGYALFSVPGILCGLCGMGKSRSKTSTSTRTVHECQNCGKIF